jgi:hypothetical protein
MAMCSLPPVPVTATALLARRMDLGYAGGRVYVSRRPLQPPWDRTVAPRGTRAVLSQTCDCEGTSKLTRCRCRARSQAFGGNPTCDVTSNVTDSCPVLAYRSVFAYCESLCSGRTQPAVQLPPGCAP